MTTRKVQLACKLVFEKTATDDLLLNLLFNKISEFIVSYCMLRAKISKGEEAQKNSASSTEKRPHLCKTTFVKKNV